MQILKLKTIIIPVLIMFISALAIFSGVYYQKTRRLSALQVEEANLRKLTFKSPGMFCAGCAASIENYIGTVEGVHSVSAGLTTKIVEAVYDPSQTSKEAILSNTILDAYGKEFLSDEAYTGETQKTQLRNLPQNLVFKLQEISSLTYEKEDLLKKYEKKFSQIDQAIEREDFGEAESLADQILEELKKLI